MKKKTGGSGLGAGSSMKRVIVVACLAIGVAVLAQAPLDYSLGSDSQAQPGVPAGTVTKHVLAPGKFFPGTPHNFQVYVPAQHDPSRPIAYMVFLDGSGYAGNGVRVPVVLDNLIARRDVPPMAAIFVDPGVMPALSGEAQNRYERIFEYDSLTPRFASFLVEELVPEAARVRGLNLSKDANDHGIAGISTGGVGAFVAAWNRPDQFRRVITWVGSFGNFRGADRLPGLIHGGGAGVCRQRREDRTGGRRPQQPARRLGPARHDPMAVAGLSAADRRQGTAVRRGPRRLRATRTAPRGRVPAAGQSTAAQRERAGRRTRRRPARRRVLVDLPRQALGAGRRDVLVGRESRGR